MAYYGLTLSTAQLAGDRYWNGFFNGLVELPANLILYFIVARSPKELLVHNTRNLNRNVLES